MVHQKGQNISSSRIGILNNEFEQLLFSNSFTIQVDESIFGTRTMTATGEDAAAIRAPVGFDHSIDTLFS
jgi:hypothetical protein